MPRRLAIMLAALGAFALFGLVLILNEPEEIELAPPLNIQAAPTSSASILIQSNALILRAVDGDTVLAILDAESGEWKIRLLGINTPESVDPRRPVECFGKEAAARLKAVVEGRRVKLEADAEADERDKYGRLLRNVYLEDGTDVNARMVRDGYARAYLRYPLNRLRKQELKSLEEEAKRAAAGLWSPAACAR